MTSFDFKTWCSDHALKQKMIDELGKCDLGSQEALKLVHVDDIATLDLTLGLKKLLLHTLEQLNGVEKVPKASREETNRNDPCHYQDIGEPWRNRRTTEKERRSFIRWPTCHPRSHRTAIVCAPREGWQQPAGVPWHRGQDRRWDNLTFSYSRLCNYCNLQWVHWEWTRNWWVYRCKYYSTCSQRHATLENISSSMGVTANARIMHKLTNTGKLSGMAQISDYHSYNVKVAELLETHTLVSVVM